METEPAHPTRPAVQEVVVNSPGGEGTTNSSDGADAQRTPKEGPHRQGTGKSKKKEDGDATGVTAPEEGVQMEEEKKQRKRKRREEKEGRREWRRALREKEEEYWDALYDRGRRMVFGMGLPHDPRRGIQLLRRAAREARHAPARWELQCLMAVQPFGDTASKPVGLTDDSEAEAPVSEDDEDGDDVEAEGGENDKRHAGGSTKKKKKKKKERGRKEREEEELEEEEAKSKRKEKGKDKKNNKKKKKKTKHNTEAATEIKKEEKKNKKRKTHSSVGSSRGSLRRESAEVTNIGSAAADSATDDWEHDSAEDEDGVELDEITEAEFREVIAAIQRVRLTTLQRLGQARSATQALNEAAAATRLSGYGDVGDATTGRHTYAMDWDKAVKAYRRHVSPLVVDIDGDAPAQGPTTATTTTASTSDVKKNQKTKKKAWRGSRRVNPRWEKIASYNLGLCYFNGEGIAQDIAVAAQLFQRAADLGYINGINSLGLCHYRGQGVELNIDKALSLFKLAADRGYVIAQYNLANCLGTGANGIYEKNLTTSACLYLRSACQGDVAAFAHLLAITRNPQYFGKKEIEYVVPTLFNQCLAKCWEEGLFGRHSWERNEGRRETSESQTEERQTQKKEKMIAKTKMKTKKTKAKKKQKKKQKMQLQSSLERTETRRGDDGRLEMNGGVDSSEAEVAAHTSNTKKKKSTKKKPAKEEKKKRDSRSRARVKARRRLEAAEKAAEDRRDCLPQEIVARMYERRNTCVRPECEQQFWGKGRVMWKFPIFLPSSSSSSSSPSSSFRATSTSAMAPTPPSAALASASLLSLLSPAATPPGFGSVEEMVARYLVYFEEEERMEASTTPDTEGEGDGVDANRQSDPNGVTGGNNDSTTSPAPPLPSSPPEGKVVWRKLLLPFCSVHCSQLTTTST